MSATEMSEGIGWVKLVMSARTAFISKGTAIAPSCSAFAPSAPCWAGGSKRSIFEYLYFAKCDFPCNMKHVLRG